MITKHHDENGTEEAGNMGVQALILAAGKGSRINPKVAGMPKPLLEVGRRPLVDHMLETLADAGVGPVAMVVGFGADEIREVVGIRAEYIHNPRWATTNSLYSFSLARTWVTGPIMVLNCDILLHPEIIDRLLAAGEDSIAYDSSSGNGREQMVDRFRDGSLIDMGKDCPLEGVAGENVGVLFLSVETAQELFNKAEQILAAGGDKEWFGAAVREIVREKKIRGVDIVGLPWVEIDYPFDLQRARKVVWPQIQKTIWKRKPHWRTLRFVILLLIFLSLIPVFLRALFPPVSPTIGTADLDGMQSVRMSMGDRTQKWWVMDLNETAMIEVVGPDPVRIETRLVLNAESGEEVPYIIEVQLDGERVGWHKLDTKPSKRARYKDWIIGKHRRVELDIPEGQHVIGTKLVAAVGTNCLIRFRQIEEDSDD